MIFKKKILVVGVVTYIIIKFFAKFHGNLLKKFEVIAYIYISNWAFFGCSHGHWMFKLGIFWINFLNALAKLRHFIKGEILRSAYFAIFHFHLNYVCIAWRLPRFTQQKVSILQKSTKNYEFRAF